jgi:oxygen-independent coproporphyrinogen-3 oxidase
VSEEPLDAEALLRERIMLGLRVAEGFDGAAARGEALHLARPFLRPRLDPELVARGRVVRDGDRLRVPREAWLWTDDTAARLF